MNGIAMAFGVAVALAGTSAHAQSSQDELMLDTLARACVGEVADHDGVVRLLADDGWAVIDNDSHPIVKALVAETNAMSQQADAPEGWQVQNTTLARQVDGQSYYFMVHGSSSPSHLASYACRIINFEATSPINPEYLGSRLGLGQPQHIEQYGFLVDRWAPPTDKLQVNSLYAVPGEADSSVSPVTGVSITLAK